MAIIAESYLLKVELPYSEYWLPLAIGMVAGLFALTFGRLVFGRKIKNMGPNQKSTDQPRNHDPFTQGSASEQRKSFRREGNPTEVFTALPNEKERPSRGWVLDRSMGGICLQVNDEVKPGVQLSVLPVNATSMTPWVDVEVRTCRAVDDGYELGCQFVKTPNWSILLMLG